MTQTLFIIAGIKVPVLAGLIGLAILGCLLLVSLMVLVVRTARERRKEAAQQVGRTQEIEARMAELTRIQAETAGRIHVMGDVLSGRHAELGHRHGDGRVWEPNAVFWRGHLQ